MHKIFDKYSITFMIEIELRVWYIYEYNEAMKFVVVIGYIGMLEMWGKVNLLPSQR